ncbi:MAG: PAS domain S-box protein [Methanomicrobiales archaeon]
MSDAPRVLCIDDESELLKIARQFLEKGGAFSVDTLTSATVALVQLKTNHYDAIVADYAMPEIDGIAFLKALKEMGNTTPVIIFTGRGREDVVIEALNNGADFYLQKGGNPLAQFTELSKMIHHAVSRKRAEEALQEAYDNLEIQVNERTIQLAETNRGLREEIEEREKTEEKIRETEATIRALMDSPVDSMMILDPNGVLIDANPTFATRVGRGIDELIGTNTYDLFSPALAKSRRAQVEEVVRLGVPIRFEDKRGDMWLDQSIHPIFDAKNNVVKIAVVARDITERKQMEEALRESEEKYRTLIETLNEGIWVIDNEAVTTFVNPKMAEILGYNEKDMIGRSLFSFMDDEGRRIAEWNIERRKNGIKEQHYFEFLQKDGTRIYASLEATPFIGKDGEYLGAIAGVADITERRLSENMLRDMSTYNRELIEASLDPLVTISREGKIQDVNSSTETITGVDRNELIGTNFHEYFTEPEKAREGYKRVFSEGKVINYPLEIRHHDGHTVPVLYNATVYYDNEGEIKGVFAAARDITERKRAEEALRIANKKLNLLSSITRHDISNQLTSLRGYLTLLGKNRSDSPKEEYIQKASKAAERIFAMIQFSKGYEQIGVQAPVWVECHTLVDKAAKDIQPGTILVKNDIPVGMEVFADPMIAKVFYNLMDNAVRYGEKIMSIRFLTTKRDNDYILICEDNGVGVLTGYKEKIFEQDFGKNTGLGLFLSREILSITGITIAETGVPGEGARFEMTVPEGLWRIKPL